MTGPLGGVTIIELGGLGPAPFCGMMLADHGAAVIEIQRPGAARPSPDILRRSRWSIEIDLKAPQGRHLVEDLCRGADGLIEGFRPGVMERLGLGPDALLAINPRLVYGRATGWGQDGPLAERAGHDINYIALSGVLHGIGPAGAKPVVPLNLIGDFGGGGMMLAFGMVAAILHSRATGEGQVIDCAMTDGSALLASMMRSLMAQGRWRDQRGVNLLDGGSHFYGVYETADGKAVAVGAIEPQFYAILLERLGLGGDPDFADQADQARWPGLRARLASLFLTRTRDEWADVFEGCDACVTPVLSLGEAPLHSHNRRRGAFVDIDGLRQPAPAPRYSLTRCKAPCPARAAPDTLLADLGVDSTRLAALRRDGVVS